MEVTLLNITPLKIGDIAIGTCWGKQRADDVVDIERMDRVANKLKHASTIEHIVANFYIKGISRLVLQELARHRIASLSVRSSRYTLKELRDEESFCSYSVATDNTLIIHASNEQIDRASKYIVLLSVDKLLPPSEINDAVYSIDLCSISALENLRLGIAHGVSNDKAKYNLPECYRTELTWSINMRSLKNFLKLRSDKSAHFEIRALAFKIWDALPDDYAFLVENEILINNEETED